MTSEEAVSWTWAVCNSSRSGSTTKLIHGYLGYTINCLRYFSSFEPVSVLSASHMLYVPPGAPQDFVPNVDRGTTATLEHPNDVTTTLFCDMAMPGRIPPKLPKISAKVSCEGGTVELFNYLAPTFYHYITVEKRGEKARTEKAYTFAEGKMEGKGEDWWTTYRYQLEAFIDKVKGRTPQTWLDKANMEWIERIYAKVSRMHASF